MILEIFLSAIIFLTLMLAKLKRWIQSTVGLSSSEANAMMVLLPSMFIIIFSEPAYRWLAQPAGGIDVKEQMLLDSLVVSLQTPIDSGKSEVMLFKFDPNSASLDELKSLGIPESVSKRIVQYRRKGGQFRVKSDLAKMYGLDSTLFQSLVPYIILPKQPDVEKPVKKEIPEVAVQYDLNLTDTTSLKTIKGIGPVLSKRIIKYRERLGGFISRDQLKEVYGLDSVILKNLSPFFVSNEFRPKSIRINEATESELTTHPYISLRDAKAIITYRLQHEKFQKHSDLFMIKSLKESTVARIGPYLSFE